MNLPKVYEASEYESDIYKLWEASGAFQPSKAHDVFSIVLPPPNATGKLHVGHAAMLAIEDTIVRHQRMKGKAVLWVPGTDHAAIATNAVMEKQVAAEGKTKHDIGREAFLQRLTDYVEDSKDTIRSQIRAMGASVDWSRERYTMEPAMNRIVGEVFLKMYEDGLIYRGNRIVNWDPIMQTTVADDELEYAEETTTLYTFKYGPFEIATARPETKFGDKYVVMHPDDKRYSKYKHGDTFEADWINGKVKATVIKDEVIDPEFGTGVMTITPCHDATDFEIAQRHELETAPVIDMEGKLLPIAKEFKGMPIAEARPKIVEKLRKKGLVVKEEANYVHNIAVNYRNKGIIEPQIKEQWFIDVNKAVVPWKGKQRSLKEVMQMVVKDGDVKILPGRFDKVYFHWIDNLRDWCISRQIWWGHRIPIWYKTDEDGQQHIQPGFTAPEGEDGWEQDPDTLDTWFSSALWTWSTLIDPEIALDPELTLEKMLKKSPDFQRFHPTTLMETGYDILFFWVARMILMTTYNTGQIPFETVYLHGMVRTKSGAKMSKSTPEEAIDPLDVVPKYGTDSLRLSMIVGQSPGNDMRIFEEKIASYRNFCNKLWNIARYIEGKVGDDFKQGHPTAETTADHWILTRLHNTLEEVDKLLGSYDIGRAYELVYHFIWDDFADWYIEASKVQLNSPLLVHVFEAVLKMTHPFAPFVTEAIWTTLAWEKVPLISQAWPESKSGDRKASGEFEDIRVIVREIRYLRTQLRMNENHLYFRNNDFIEANGALICYLTGLVGVAKVEEGKGLHLSQTKHDCWIDVEEQKIYDYLNKLVVIRDERQATVDRLKSRLANSDYVKRAPREVVAQTKEQLHQELELLEKAKHEVATFESNLEHAPTLPTSDKVDEDLE